MYLINYTTLYENYNTKKETCDRNEMYITDWVYDNRQQIRITELYMVCEHVISIWCEASMRCNQSLYASWHGIKVALDIFLGNVPPRSLYASP